MMRFLLFLFLTCSALRGAIPPPATWDYEAAAWKAVILTNSSSISDASYQIGTRFMLRSKWWGLRKYFGRVNIYLGNDLICAACPIVHDWWLNNDDLDSLNNFVSADYSETNGLAGNTTTKYMLCNGSSGVNLSAFTVHTNIHLAAYVRTGSNEASDVSGIAYAGVANYALAIANGGNTYIFMGLNFSNTADSNGKGFYLSSRTATNLAVVYKNGTALITDSSNNPGTVQNGTPAIHAFNSAGTINNWTSRAISYHCYGFGVPAEQQLSYYILVHNVQAEANRAVE